jgi:catechol 2,3-dioxygenase-like lactoylglutathione lyase family enzyme
MRTALVFVMGLLIGASVMSGAAQGERPQGDDYVNHVAIAVEDIDAAFAFYIQKMGFREGFVRRDENGQLQLAYVQVSRNTFIELQRTTPERRAGLNHYGLHVEDLRATVSALKQRGVTVEEARAGRPGEDSMVANATDPSGIRIEMFQFGPNSAQGRAIAAWK